MDSAMGDFAKALPKIELHAHLSGSISRQCMHEIWQERKNANPSMTLEDPLIEMPLDKYDYNLETFFPLFSKYIYSLIDDLPSLITSTSSVLDDFAAENVAYIELRTTPRAFPNANPPISKSLYISTILSCINSSPTKTSMTTKLLLSIDRRNSLAQALEVISLAQEFRDHGVVGIDLCGDPSVTPITHLAPAFEAAKAADLPITIHFAEAEKTSSVEELRELLSWGPQRLGHVIHVPEVIKQEILRQGLGLELCLSCNVHAKMITGTYSDHHFGEWLMKDVPVVLCTDDVGVFGSPLSNEYSLVAEHFALGQEELRILARRGIECIFGGEEEKERLRRIMK